MFADIHNHLLPGVDDGAQTLDDTLLLLDQAMQAGITEFCLTPHVHGDLDSLERITDLQKAFAALQHELAGRDHPAKLSFGCEIYCTTAIADVAVMKEFTYSGLGRHVLIELPPTEAPHYFAEMMFRLKLEGITPVLAHPERNMALLNKPEILVRYLKIGVLTQITSGSLAGDFGNVIQEFARRIVRSNACTVVASDAHNIHRRSFAATRRAFNEAVELIGETRARELFWEHPKKIIEGQELRLPEFDDESAHELQRTKKRKFFFF